MLPNPYSPGSPPRRFVGREEETGRLLDALAPVVAFNQMMGPLWVVTGPRGFGKTSLLAQVGDRAAQNGLVVAWSAGLKRQPFLGAVLGSVTRALERADVTRGASPRRKLDEVSVQINAGLVKAAASLGPKPDKEPPQLPQGADLVGQIEDFMLQAAGLVADRGGAGLLVVVDELHAPLEYSDGRHPSQAAQPVMEAGALLNAIQIMATRRDDYPLGMIGAGLPQTKPLLMGAATFGERSREIKLSKLDDATARQLLADSAQEAGVRWAPDALDQAVQAGGGYPEALQTIGSAVWLAARPRKGDQLTPAHLQAAQPQIANDMTSMFDARWATATPAEKQFLTAMAATGDDTASRAAIAEDLGTDSNSLSMARASLIAKGIIEAPARGQLAFTIPGFGQHVLAQDPAN